MAFIGNTPTTQGFIPAVDFFSGNGSATAFTLSRPVASVAQVQAVVENVPQTPGDAYTVSGNTITFTSAPASGTNNIYVYYTSPITQVIAPSQGTVFPTSMSTGGPSWDTSGTLSATTLRSNNYYDASGGSNAQLYGVASPPNSMGFRNRLINSDMRIDQRNAGASIAVTSSETYPVDRFAVRSDATGLSATMQRSTVAPSGFNNSLLVNVTTGGSIGASDRGFLRQFIEGFNVADFGFGTANAATITLSFWVRSSLTGTFSGALQNSAQDRSYVFTFSISVANTWEYKTITIAGSTSGTWVTDNGIGLRFWIDIGNGSSLRTSSTGSWQTSDVRGATGSVSLVANSGATFYITGVQLEAGTVASPFERRDYGRELMMCQRYYQKSYNVDVAPGTNTTVGAKTSRIYNTDAYLPQLETRLLVSMRATPTVTWYTTAGTSGSVNVGVGTNTVNTQYDAGMNSTGWLYVNGSVSSGNQITAQFVASSEL